MTNLSPSVECEHGIASHQIQNCMGWAKLESEHAAKISERNIIMGAWSKESFGNDTACDWAYGLEKTSDFSLVRETIQKVLDVGDEYLDADEASEVIAAVEVIARLKGNFGVRDSYSESTDTWVKTHPQQPSQDLVALAIQAIDRVLVQPSELLELWEESNEFEAWKNSVLDLRNRASKLA